jgi:hypothetical protein
LDNSHAVERDGGWSKGRICGKVYKFYVFVVYVACLRETFRLCLVFFLKVVFVLWENCVFCQGSQMNKIGLLYEIEMEKCC